MRRIEKESPMKTKLSFVAAALLFSVVTTGSCYAQQTVLDVKIPFAFQAENHCRRENIAWNALSEEQS
jgi:hypothetical protein